MESLHSPLGGRGPVIIIPSIRPAGARLTRDPRRARPRVYAGSSNSEETSSWLT